MVVGLELATFCSLFSLVQYLNHQASLFKKIKPPGCRYSTVRLLLIGPEGRFLVIPLRWSLYSFSKHYLTVRVTFLSSASDFYISVAILFLSDGRSWWCVRTPDHESTNQPNGTPTLPGLSGPQHAPTPSSVWVWTSTQLPPSSSTSWFWGVFTGHPVLLWHSWSSGRQQRILGTDTWTWRVRTSSTHGLPTAWIPAPASALCCLCTRVSHRSRGKSRLPTQ